MLRGLIIKDFTLRKSISKRDSDTTLTRKQAPWGKKRRVRA